MQATQTFQNKPTDHARGIMKLGIPQPPHYLIGVERVHGRQSECERHGLSNILKLQPYKTCSCIQFITNEQVKLISFI